MSSSDSLSELLLLAGGAKSGEDDGDASRVKLILRMLKVPRLLRVGRLFKMLDLLELITLVFQELQKNH